MEATARTACTAEPVAHLRSALCVLLPVVLEASRLLSGLAVLVVTAVPVVAAVHMAQARLVLAARTVETVVPVADQMQERLAQDKGRPHATLAIQAERSVLAAVAAAVVLLELPEVLAAVVKAAMEQQQEHPAQQTMAAAVAAAVIMALTATMAARAVLES